MLYYNPKFKAHYEVKREIYDCLDRLVRNIDEMNKIYTRIDNFKRKCNFFS